jgi:isocitrate dehydrogenase kinase/phosphatase
MASLTDSRLATLCAETARDEFLNYEAGFKAITKRARDRFAQRDWTGSHADAAERLHLYSRVLDKLVSEIRRLMGGRLPERSVWVAMKAVYSSLISESLRWEIAESFFNSLTRRIFATEGVDQSIEFVDTDFDAPPTRPTAPVWKPFSGRNLSELLSAALTDIQIGGFEEERWRNLRGDIELASERLLPILPAEQSELELELVSALFSRGQGAYLVGRFTSTSADESVPVAFCLLHSQSGITLDAALIGEADLSILFSYTRAYFRVDAPCPYQLVRWLRKLMPLKRLADLYNAIGFNRHAKTEFYRDFIRHLGNSEDRFVTAEGARGMVMLVFTLPSYDVVFKIIRDRFDAPKENDRADVMRRYRIVFEHDRAGRLVEAHEFEHLRIGRDRFEHSLFEDLLQNAAATVRLETDDLVIGHAYVERRVRPLNLFFRECSAEQSVVAARDYGQAIKDLAASNIFPGDLLTKNFGLTRRGRVVFYDYDELTLLTDCNFRELPQATSYEEEISAEPWFSVRENDIFPEELPNFLFFPEPARKALLKEQGDLFRPEFWRRVQEKLRLGELPEVFPYAQERRLRNE